MPIRPENKNRYPSNWKDIRLEILRRANNKCEGCLLENCSFVLRDNHSDDFCPEATKIPGSDDEFKRGHPDHRRVKVILTIAHLDHIPENCTHEI